MSARRLLVPVLAGALSLLGSTGCAGFGDGMTEKFYEANRNYNRSLRWGDYDRAAEFIPPEGVDAFLDAHEGLDEKIVILDYQPVRFKLDKKAGLAASRMELQWHTEDRLIVERTLVDQVWQWNDGAWVLVDERRAQGEPMSMFIEREEPAHPWLPGLEAYREAHDIGYSDDEKRKRNRKRRKDAKARGEEKPRHPDAGWGNDLDPAPELESDPADMYSER